MGTTPSRQFPFTYKRLEVYWRVNMENHKRNANHDKANFNIRAKLVAKLWECRDPETQAPIIRAIRVAENLD